MNPPLAVGRPPPRPATPHSPPRSTLRLKVASAEPLHFLAAADVLEAAVGGHAELLDGLLFPSGLEPPTPGPTADSSGSSATGTPPASAAPLALPAPAPASTAGAGPSGAVKPATGAPKAVPHSALDGLLEMLGAGPGAPPAVRLADLGPGGVRQPERCWLTGDAAGWVPGACSSSACDSLAAAAGGYARRDQLSTTELHLCLSPHPYRRSRVRPGASRLPCGPSPP